MSTETPVQPLTLKAVAERAGVSPLTVKQWYRVGREGLDGQTVKLEVERDARGRVFTTLAGYQRFMAAIGRTDVNLDEFLAGQAARNRIAQQGQDAMARMRKRGVPIPDTAGAM